MREIKFRAWDKKIQQFIDAKEIVINDGKVFRNWQDYEDYIPDDGTIELVWYTSSHDPSGTEIYDGDVLEEECEYWVVEFYDAAFWVVAIGGTAVAELLIENNYMDIVGNRYENPELLEDAE